MDFLLLQIFAFLRPIMFIETPFSLAGLNLFEIGAILLSLLLILGVLVRMTLMKDVGVDGIDLAMIGFSGWCIAVFVIYIDQADVKELGKFVLPFLTYLAAKSVIRDVEQYRRILWLLIVGFGLPVAASTVLTLLGLGVDRVNFWTGIPRYLGVYSGPHNMGHNMTFLIMLMVLYFTIGRSQAGGIGLSRVRMGYLGVMALAALYCLYMTGVRTAILGLGVFVVMLLFIYRRKHLLIGAAVVVVALPILKDDIVHHLYYEAVMAEKSQEHSVENIASGRPRIWETVWGEFSGMPLDRKLAGVGIGNSWDKPGSNLKVIEDSHNDFLEVLIQTGYVGFALFLALHVLLLRGVLRLQGLERHVLLALFVAVVVMNLASNSYVSRFGLAQMYYLVLSYVALAMRSAEPRPAVASPPAVPGRGRPRGSIEWQRGEVRRGFARTRTP